jgi:hypothetical protein
MESMNRIAYVWLSGIVLAGTLMVAQTAQNSQPLGDYARAVRKDKKQAAAKQFDNDNLPVNDKLSVVGKESEPASDTAAVAPNGDQSQAGAAGTDQKPADNSAAKPAAKPDTAQDRQKAYAEWQGKIASQKSQIELLTRELDVAQREYRLRAAAMYADAGNRLRNSGSWDKEDAQYKQQIDGKQKALDTAKQQLQDMQEAARKAGVPSTMRE